MKRLTNILIIIMLLLITGCSNKNVVKHDYTYKGENEHWIAEYRVNGKTTFSQKDNKLHAESNGNSLLTVAYKKDLSELTSVKHLEISYDSTFGGGKVITEYDNNNPINKKTFIFSFGSGNAMDNGNGKVNVTINIDGKIESIDLRNYQL